MQSNIRGEITARQFDEEVKKGIKIGADEVDGILDHLEDIGIHISTDAVEEIFEKMSAGGMYIGMDDLTAGLTTSNVGAPVQFLQTWLPGTVNIVTAPRMIDTLVGIVSAGSFEDAEVVWPVIENTGLAVPYGDYTQTPRAGWNQNFNRRTVVRFEDGIQVSKVEEARAARMRINSAEEKRKGAALSLNISRNMIGFKGFNSGDGGTYGLFNDPGLPAYTSIPSGTNGATWAVKTYDEIVKDIITMVNALRTRSNGLINAEDTPTTLAVPTNAVGFLATVNALGSQSVRQWIAMTYPQMRVVSAPELNDANSAGVVYLYADFVNDGLSTDGGATFSQVVPTTFMMLGAQRTEKSYVEAYANATAGVILKRPYAIVRYTGVS